MGRGQKARPDPVCDRRHPERDPRIDETAAAREETAYRVRDGETEIIEGPHQRPFDIAATRAAGRGRVLFQLTTKNFFFYVSGNFRVKARRTILYK